MQDKRHSLMDYRKPIVMAALCAGIALSLQGCVAVIVGGAVMGTMAATDRRSLGAQAEDASIVLKGSGRIEKVVADLGRVSVVSFNRKVLLTGEVKDEKMKKEVEKEISTLAGVSLPITNEIVVAPLSSFGARSNDLSYHRYQRHLCERCKSTHGSWRGVFDGASNTTRIKNLCRSSKPHRWRYTKNCEVI
jgi:hypothetical protein